MATLNELYNYYLKQGITYTPGSTIGGLSSLTENTNINTNINTGNSGGDGTTTATTSTGKGSLGFSMPDVSVMDIAMVAINPPMGLANLASKSMTNKSLAQNVMGAFGFGGSGTTAGPGVDQGVGPGGCDAGSSADQGVGPGGCDPGGGDGGNGGAGAGGGDAGTGPGGCGFAAGGRVNFSNGGSYWQTVQETYDAAGGEEGTGMGLIDFANKYFPKMADGGRAGYLQGGLVSLLR